MANYAVFQLTGNSLSSLTLTSPPSNSLVAGNRGVTGTGSGSTPSVLGSPNDNSLTISGGPITGSLTYEGTATYTSGTGFVIYNGTNYYLVTLNAQQPSAGSSIPVTTPPGNSSTGEWNLSTSSSGCFLAGAMIATPSGEVPVESLTAGALVLTADGRAVPVRWVGNTVISRMFADPVRVLPIRIKAGALDVNVPARDLLVSPGHAILVDGVLVHAAALVNGTSIVRDDDAPIVFTYYHVELDSHDVLLADGAPAESFLEGVEDMNFTNWADRVAPAEIAELAYPRAKSGRQVPRATRERLAARAAELAGMVAAAA